MNAGGVALLVAAGLVALVDWWSVATDRRRVEYVAKPLTLALLIATALALDPNDRAVQVWFVIALAMSLVGDIALMAPGDRFVEGLGAFLLAHVAYVVGMVVIGVDAAGLIAALAVVAVVGGAVGPRVVRGAPGALRIPVTLYVAVISTMVVFAGGTTEPWIIAGALLFYVSDALIGWTRFGGDVRHGRLAVMVTYHLGQAGLVVGLT